MLSIENAFSESKVYSTQLTRRLDQHGSFVEEEKQHNSNPRRSIV